MTLGTSTALGRHRGAAWHTRKKEVVNMLRDESPKHNGRGNS